MDKRRKNPWSEEYDEEDMRPEDYERLIEEAEKRQARELAKEKAKAREEENQQ